MARIRVRVTVTLPPDANGHAPPVGEIIWADPDEPFVATQLSVGHMVPVGDPPKVAPESGPAKK
jgi:hypothetical protein